MKKIVLFSIALFLASTISAQKITEDNLPVAVSSAFKSKFDKAESVKWELDYENYNAEFTLKKYQMLATFSKDGSWLLTQTYIKLSEVPKPVKDILIKEFGELSGYSYDDIVKEEMPNKENVYQISVVKGEKTIEMEITEAGVINKREQKKGK